MSKIKLRPKTKDIKAMNKTKAISRNMKSTLIKLKDKAEETQRSNQDNPHTYATDSISQKAKNISSNTSHMIERYGWKSVKNAPDTIRKAKAGAANIKRKIQAASKAGKGTKTTIKTSAQVAKTSAKAAQSAMKNSQRAARAARVATQTAIRTAKITAKAVITSIKAIIAAVKGLISLIAAGGWVAVVIILIVCMIAFIVSSPFGLFYSDNKTDTNNITLSSAIEEINGSFAEEIELIKSENPHDEVDGITTPQNWRDVLAVYAVKTTADPNNPTEVATMDTAKLEILRTVFWYMNAITFTLETVEPEDDSSEVSAKTILHISVQSNTCSDMAAFYNFNAEQNDNLDELMSSQYDSLWEDILDHLS